MREDQNLEWKEAWREEHLKWVCAFANGAGATLVIGRDDTGHAVGADDTAKLLDDLPNKIRDLLGVVVQLIRGSADGTDPVDQLLAALRLGLIERTNPEHPTSRLQEYRLTGAGRERLVRLGGRV